MNRHPSRIAEKTASVFHRSFFVIFILLFFLSILAGYLCSAIVGELGTLELPWYRVILRYLLLLLSFGVIAAVLIHAYRLLNTDRFACLDRRRANTRLIFITVGLMLLVQLTCAYFLRMHPVTDVRSVEVYAKEIAVSGSLNCLNEDLTSDYYIVRYQNNLPYLFLVTGIYRLTYLLTGTLSRVPILILNTLALNASVLMTVLTARRLFGERKAIFTLLLCVLFTPYYTYAAYYYTDSFALPLVTGAVYTLVIALQSATRGKKLGFLLLSGLQCGVGFEIKATVAILLVAAALYCLLQYGIKRALKMIAPLLLGFAVVFASYSGVMRAIQPIDPAVSDSRQYPLTHWVMMGLGNDEEPLGGYSYADSVLTGEQETKAEKIALNLKEIRSRIAKMGVFGMIFHLGLKSVWSWMDGTYYISYYLRDFCQWTPLHSLVLYEGRYRFFYYAAASGLQLFLLLMMAYSALDACRKKRIDLTLFFRLAVIGLWLFLLIWETNSRYPFQFTPLYLMLAADGVSRYVERRSKSRFFFQKAFSLGRRCRPKGDG